jgi:TldD protein
MDWSRKEQLFASSEGAWIEQEITSCGAGYTATAVGDGDFQMRSYPNSFRGQFETRGYEMVHDWRLLENAPRVAGEAAALLRADPCPEGERDLVLDGSQVGLQIHESCGHPAELDRVLGSEANYAGLSFLTLDLLGTLRDGSEHVTIRADAVTPRGMGTFGFDDEGVPAQSWDLVRDGLFVGYLTSRETAARIGEQASRGCMRADGWRNLPLVRMPNVSLEPGRWALDDLIADTDDGIYMDVNRSWSIDQYRLNFQFGTELGWEIKRGRRVRLLRNPTYQGMTVDFWNRCDAVCDAAHWTLWGIPSCGKGQPGQVMATGHGAAPARFRQVRVGVAHA